MPDDHSKLQDSVLTVARGDFTTLRESWTVNEALEAIRREGVGERVIYFYVVDGERRLRGVVPTRRILTADPERRLAELMIQRVVVVPHTATVLEACELFIFYKFLALPVVDAERRMIGVVDLGVFAQEVFDVAEREQMEEVFASIGFRIAQVRDASVWRAFRYRFPWLLATMGSGLLCALLAGAFELTLARSLALAFFLALVLGIGESVSIQSMALTLQALRATRPTLAWFATALMREGRTALLLGAAAGGGVGILVWLWQGALSTATAIAVSIFLSVCSASLLGMTVPAVLHALRLDPKIAAGPVTLALADLCTLLFYFAVAAALL